MHWWLSPVILATQEAEMEATLGKQFVRPYLKKDPSQKIVWWSSSRCRP
jgi:hypothetical protein